VGMAPELMATKFTMDHLFDKHGGPFVVNASFLGGRAVCIREADSIADVQVKQAHELTMTLQGAVVLRVLHRPSKLILGGKEWVGLNFATRRHV
jgi:hypothetical protein